MRRRAPQLFATVAAVLFLQLAGAGQINKRPTREPIVTAESEGWYLDGDPITFAGIIYYPTGPNVYFDPETMVRSGDYRGIPLYSLTTIEPYSRVYVPLTGRLMKPYERRRSGDLEGTSGSTLPSMLVPSPYEPWTREEVLAGMALAPAPPTVLTPMIGAEYYEPVGTRPHAPPEPVSTTGSSIPEYPLGPLVSAREPEGLDAVFVEYREQRWFSSGPAVELTGPEFTRIGEYNVFPVYRRTGEENTIYITVAKRAENLLAPYSVRR